MDTLGSIVIAMVNVSPVATSCVAEDTLTTVACAIATPHITNKQNKRNRDKIPSPISFLCLMSPHDSLSRSNSALLLLCQGH